MDWENNTVLQNCAHKPAANSLITSMTTHSLSQLQREPTRGDNVLDLFITNKPSITKSCISVPGMSDHFAVVAETVIIFHITAVLRVPSISTKELTGKHQIIGQTLTTPVKINQGRKLADFPFFSLQPPMVE